MKRLFLFVFTMMTCALTSAIAQPKIEIVDGNQLNFGDVFHGKKAEKIVMVKNIGKDTLKISEVRTQCGCTAAMMSETDKRLGPNQVGQLSIAFDTHNYSGQVSKQVYISSNDTSNPKVTITFTTNVMDVLTFDPKMVSFNDMKVDSTATRMVTVSNPSSKLPLKILSVDSKNPLLKVSFMKNELMPGEKTQMQAMFTPEKSGQFQGVIEITTNHPTDPKITISFFAWVTRK
jgi:hypothetical protein